MKSGIEKLFITTSEEVLIALLDGPQKNNIVAERAGITEQHLSRLLPRLVDHQLIFSRYSRNQRINRLSSKGRAIAQFAKQKKEAINTQAIGEDERHWSERWIKDGREPWPQPF